MCCYHSFMKEDQIGKGLNCAVEFDSSSFSATAWTAPATIRFLEIQGQIWRQGNEGLSSNFALDEGFMTMGRIRVSPYMWRLRRVFAVWMLVYGTTMPRIIIGSTVIPATSGRPSFRSRQQKTTANRSRCWGDSFKGISYGRRYIVVSIILVQVRQ
mmetsp:Transcript_50618/g.152514  ORF Transcript_50618/g.152514 Transcript_50618/m.152514 type:complete len:156 (+) Transcript_50618:280-747(+)